MREQAALCGSRKRCQDPRQALSSTSSLRLSFCCCRAGDGPGKLDGPSGWGGGATLHSPTVQLCPNRVLIWAASRKSRSTAKKEQRFPPVACTHDVPFMGGRLLLHMEVPFLTMTLNVMALLGQAADPSDPALSVLCPPLL